MDKMYMVMKPEAEQHKVDNSEIVTNERRLKFYPSFYSSMKMYHPVYTSDRDLVLKACNKGWMVYSLDDGCRRVKSMTVDYHEELV